MHSTHSKLWSSAVNNTKVPVCIASSERRHERVDRYYTVSIKNIELIIKYCTAVITVATHWGSAQRNWGSISTCSFHREGRRRK